MKDDQIMVIGAGYVATTGMTDQSAQDFAKVARCLNLIGCACTTKPNVDVQFRSALSAEGSRVELDTPANGVIARAIKLRA